MNKYLHPTAIKGYLNQATISLWRHKLRSLLTGLGIVIGIAAVIVVISAGQGVQGLIVGQLNSFGSNIIQVETKVPSVAARSSDEAQARAFGTVVTTLKLDDAMAMRRLPNIKTNYAAQVGQAVVTALDSKKTAMLYGVTPAFFDIDASRVAVGRIFTEEDDAGLARVVVLGRGIARDLFGDSSPIGQEVKIKQKGFKVIGVLAPRGSVTFFDMDAIVYMPVQTLQKQVVGIDYIASVTNQYIDKAQMPVTIAAIEDLLRQRHHIDTGSTDDTSKDDFVVQSMDEAMNILDTVIGGFTMLLVALAAISLVVGGVGITNIMYVSVLERTFEIGLRKAVGATRRQVMGQFLAEAVLLTGAGGLSGIVAGVAVAYGISALARLQGFSWDFVVPLYAVILSFTVSVACGVIFGLYPARKAAELDPVEALRHE